MVPRPVACLAILLPCVLVGCHAGTANNLAKPAPAPIKTQEMVSKDRFIAMHNSNAKAITSLKAFPKIELTEGLKERPKTHSLKGRMALERSQRFNLEILGPAKTSVAKIGSNDDGFWFWVKDNQERELYTCAYENLDASPLAATFQPDWITEAMGLRVIDPAEARVLSARPGDKKDSLILTQLRKDSRGEMLTKETVVDVRDGKIIEHRLYSGAKAKLLASATITMYGQKQLEPTAEFPTARVVHYPSRFRLEWVAEDFALDIAMDAPIINPPFDDSLRAELFTEPKIPGYARVDLAKVGGPERAAATAPSSRIHETRPAPRSGSGSGVRLGEPQPIGDGAMQTSAEPLALASESGDAPSRTQSVVGAPVPRAIEPPQAATASTAGLNRLRGPTLGR